MIGKIRIQNFRSLQDATLSLNQINLLIGANNAGKTNFLKALRFFGRFLNGDHSNKEELKRMFYNYDDANPIIITIVLEQGEEQVLYRLEYHSRNDYLEFIGLSDIGNSSLELVKTDNIEEIDAYFSEFIFSSESPKFYPVLRSMIDARRIDEFTDRLSVIVQKDGEDVLKEYNDSYSTILSGHRYNLHDSLGNASKEIFRVFCLIKIFNPDPNKLSEPYGTKPFEGFYENVENLVSFLDWAIGEDYKILSRISEEIEKCIPEFNRIKFANLPAQHPDHAKIKSAFPKDTIKRFGLVDAKDRVFWADDLSEGVLYFVALLSIILQPNPPKLLLLEEPEKGIHPRRIDEVMDYIEALALDKEIQIIMTTHNPLVVDRFAHDPAGVFVFDKKEGITMVQNLQDVIESHDKAFAEQEIDKIDFSESLGDYWLMGYLNGIPND